MIRPRVAVLALFLAIFVLNADAHAATQVSCSSPTGSRAQLVEYFVSLADAPTHVAHVSIRLSHAEGAQILNMPVWNALYQVRNFAANVENVRAQGQSGAAVEVRNLRPSEWEVAAPAGCVVVT